MEVGELFLTERKVRFWILATLSFMLIWIIRWVPEGLIRFYNIVFVSWDYYPRAVVGGWMYSLATIGLVSRLIGVVIGIVALLLVQKRSLFEVRKWVVAALSLESLYYLLLIPSPVYLFAIASESHVSYTFAASYVLQIAFTGPFLAILAVKVLKQEKQAINFQLRKWVGIAFFGYVVALWSNSVLRWFDMIGKAEVEFFYSGRNVFGTLNAFVFMSLAVIFAAFGAFCLAKQKRAAGKWIGASLVMVGLQYTNYVVFSYLIGALNEIWLVDVWAAPLLGLGMVILLDRTKIDAPI